MGEYARFENQRVKIGTCENMYYLRYDQRTLVHPLDGNINPCDPDALTYIRFRFPFPDVDEARAMFAPTLEWIERMEAVGRGDETAYTRKVIERAMAGLEQPVRVAVRP